MYVPVNAGIPRTTIIEDIPPISVIPLLTACIRIHGPAFHSVPVEVVHIRLGICSPHCKDQQFVLHDRLPDKLGRLDRSSRRHSRDCLILLPVECHLHRIGLAYLAFPSCRRMVVAVTRVIDQLFATVRRADSNSSSLNATVVDWVLHRATTGHQHIHLLIGDTSLNADHRIYLVIVQVDFLLTTHRQQQDCQYIQVPHYLHVSKSNRKRYRRDNAEERSLHSLGA